MLPNHPHIRARIFAIIGVTFVVGLGGEFLGKAVGPWAKEALTYAVFGVLILAIIRPRTSAVDWKKQVGIGLALVVALFAAINFIGTRSSWDALWALIGLTLIWTFMSMAFGGDAPALGGVLGSAQFGSDADVQELTDNGGDLIIGRSDTGKLLRYDGPAHLLTIAPTRSGKGVGTLIPNLLTAQRSIICIDPKGENARVTGRQREQFGPVYYLDPFGLSGRRSAAFNPLAALDPESLDLAEDSMTLAEALVFDQDNNSDPHWNEEAKALLAGIILYTVCHDAPEHRTLATVREYLTLAPEHFQSLLTVMQASPKANGLIARAANRYLSKSDREAAGVLSGVQRHTHFLDSPRICEVASRSDFTFASLKERNATVFLILPPDRLDTYARWLRLLLTQALTEMARSPAKPVRPVLFLLDEFAALGRLQSIERAMGLMAGYGLQLWPILQDMHQLKGHYSERAGTFLSNAGVLQAFGVNDYETAEMLSKTIGKTTVRYVTRSQSQKTGFFAEPDRSESYSEHISARSLLEPNEIMKLEPRDMLLMMTGKDPLILQKIRYYDEPEFSGLFDNS